MENTELIEIINESVKRGYAEKTKGGYYRWLRGNPLLAYFVQQLSEYLDLSEKLYERKTEKLNQLTGLISVVSLKRKDEEGNGSWQTETNFMTIRGGQ